jgi:hypothetical protein
MVHFCFSANIVRPQTPSASDEPAGTSTDLFVMLGSDFDRPGLLPRANYNISIGHTLPFLKKSPIGDELTFGYTPENSSTHSASAASRCFKRSLTCTEGAENPPKLD